MYKRKDGQMTVEDFILPFSGQLDKRNRWVKLSQLVPWDMFEERYAALFGDVGLPAKPARMALGALLIQTRLRLTDEETVDQIRENPYLQYFVGMREYTIEPPFEASSMVRFRKRINAQMLQTVDEAIRPSANHEDKDEDDKANKDDDTPDSSGGGGNTGASSKGSEKPGNKGALLMDATCAPQDIRYPTDISLLNEAREKLEGYVDILFGSIPNLHVKPRTYRQIAHKSYVLFTKHRKPRSKTIRKALRKQLGYVRRDLEIVDELLILAGLDILSERQLQELITIHKLFTQQDEMYIKRSHSTEKRIVSIAQPHVRPIVRGKAGRDVEFGAKLLVSVVDGYATVERLSWENFNEGINLIQLAQAYLARYGVYPAVILADKIFRTRENRAWCKEHGIRLSGPPLGRPRKDTQRETRMIEAQDNAERNAIEGKFGQGKRRFGLGRIMAKLKDTSETAIHLQFLVMNLEHRLRVFLRFLLEWLFLQDYWTALA